VLNAPAIAYHDKAPPQEVVSAFPGAMDNSKTSNGSISFLIGEKSISKGMDQPLSQLIGFRQYLHYHIHAIKIQMHTKMRLRVNMMELIIRQARRDEDDKTTVAKEKHGGN